MPKRKIVVALGILLVGILAGIRIACHALAEATIAGDGWGYLDRALYIHELGKLPPLTIQPVGYSIALSKLAPFGKEGLLQASTRIQQILDLATVLALGCFGFVLSAKIALKSTRIVFILGCLSLLLIQPFTAKLSNSLYTETSVMALSFLGVGLFSLLITRGFRYWPVETVITVLGGMAMGIASTMRIDILALNVTFLLTALACFVFLKRPSKTRKAACFLAASLIIPLALLISQYHATGELGFQTYNKKSYPIEFIGWTGTWRADRREHATYAWFSSSVDNLNTNLYPAKAFKSSDEKQEVESLFRTWRQQGYNEFVRSGFEKLTRNKRALHPVDHYIANPLYRMYHHWINLEGADFYLSSFKIQSGLASRALVAAIFAIRVAIVMLFIYGSFAFAFKAQQTLLTFYGTKMSSTSSAIEFSDYLVGFSILFALLRTLEMGILSTMNAGGLMEPRYVIVAFPPVLIVSIYGAFRLTCFIGGSQSCHA